MFTINFRRELERCWKSRVSVTRTGTTSQAVGYSEFNQSKYRPVQRYDSTPSSRQQLLQHTTSVPASSYSSPQYATSAVAAASPGAKDMENMQMGSIDTGSMGQHQQRDNNYFLHPPAYNDDMLRRQQQMLETKLNTIVLMSE